MFSLRYMANPDASTKIYRFSQDPFWVAHRSRMLATASANLPASPVLEGVLISVNLRLLDYVPDVETGRTVSVKLFHQTVSDSANFFGGLLGANIIFADQQHHALNKLEGMIQH